MSPRTMRRSERAAHLLWAVVLVLYVYGLLPSWGESAVRWVVVPGIAASGFAMWFAAPLRKLGKRVRAWAWSALGTATRPPERKARPAVRPSGRTVAGGADRR